MHFPNALFFKLSPVSLIPSSISPALPLFARLSCLDFHIYCILFVLPLSAPVFFFLSQLSFRPSVSPHPCPGSSVSGHDESPGDHATADAADPPAAGALPPAAPGPAPAAAGCDAAAGTHTRKQKQTR